MAQQLGEPLEARIPEAFVTAQPIVRARQGARIDAAVMDASAHSSLNEPGFLEPLDVFGRGGERHAIGRCQLANGLLSLGESLEHRASGPVAERPEDEIEACVLFNHMVEHISAR